jgi:hypothetical protein
MLSKTTSKLLGVYTNRFTGSQKVPLVCRPAFRRWLFVALYFSASLWFRTQADEHKIER